MKLTANSDEYSFPEPIRQKLADLLGGASSPGLIAEIEDWVRSFRVHHVEEMPKGGKRRRNTSKRTRATQAYARITRILMSAESKLGEIKRNVVVELESEIRSRFQPSVPMDLCLKTIAALKYEVSELLRSRQRRGGPRKAARSFFVFHLALMLRSNGLRLTAFKKDTFGKILSLLLPETPFSWRDVLYPIMRTALRDVSLHDLGEARLKELKTLRPRG